MPNKNYMIGVLQSGSFLETEAGRILLTTISMQAARTPESAPVMLPSDDVGKWALVTGKPSGNILYSAHIVEIIPRITGEVLNRFVKDGMIEHSELQKKFSDTANTIIGNGVEKKLCALVIGHKKSSPGAVNTNSNLSEFVVNEDMSLRIEQKVTGVNIQRIYRRMFDQLPGDINALDPDFIVSLHCNAFNKEVSGTEVLYYHKSEKGKKMAEILLNHLVGHLGLPNRGILPRTSEDRGGTLLRYTNAPCVIAEPFFIDNDNDLAKAQQGLDGLAKVYAAAIEEIAEVVF